MLGCWNSPYGDWFIKSQVELVKRLDWDGYNMDGFGCWAQCFCPSCAGSYKDDTGKEIPATGDVNSPDFRHYLKWRLDRYTQFRLQVDGRAQGRQTRLRGGTLDDGPGPLVALDGRSGGRGNRRRAPRARRSVPRAVLGFSPRPGKQPAAGVHLPLLPRADRRPAGVDLALPVRAGPVQHAAASRPSATCAR